MNMTLTLTYVDTPIAHKKENDTEPKTMRDTEPDNDLDIGPVHCTVYMATCPDMDMALDQTLILTLTPPFFFWPQKRPCVSDLQSIYKAESWQRAVTLDDSQTPT
jgi:hypothetical protein